VLLGSCLHVQGLLAWQKGRTRGVGTMAVKTTWVESRRWWRPDTCQALEGGGFPQSHKQSEDGLVEFPKTTKLQGGGFSQNRGRLPRVGRNRGQDRSIKQFGWTRVNISKVALRLSEVSKSRWPYDEILCIFFGFAPTDL
jgi:hypothetical protein